MNDKAGTPQESWPAVLGPSVSRRRFLRSIAGGTGALALAACGATPPAAPSASVGAAASPSAAASTATASGAASEAAAPSAVASAATESAATTAAAAPSGTLTLAQGIDPRSLWANSSTAQQEINISEQISEKLIEFSPDAASFEPRLALEWEQIDDTTLEMKLREGVSFTNGEPFNAESAVFSVGIWLAAPSYASFAGVIDRAEAVDDYTIRIITKEPTLLHMPALAQGSFQYPPAHYQEVGEEAFGTAPIGTGPFKFVSWERGSAVTLEANTDYWGGAPAIQTVVFRNIPESTAKLAALETGEIDFAIDIPLDAVDRIEANPDLQLFSRPSNRIFYLVASTLTDTPLKEPAVRRALWHAVDVPSLIASLLRGRASQLNGQITVEGFFGHDPERKPAVYDPELAKQLLAEAGYPDGFDIVFKYSSGRYAQDKEIGQAIAAQLANVGINVTQEVLESGTFLTQLTSKELNDMYLGGSLPPPDSHFMFQQFGSTFRYSYYANPEIDRLITEGASTADEAERFEVYQQMLAIFDEDPPYIPLYRPEDYYSGSTRLSGFEPRASQFIDVRTFTLSS